MRAETEIPALFSKLIIAPAFSGPCLHDAAEAVDVRWIEHDTWACMRVTNSSEDRGVWRLDFDSVIGEGVTFWVTQGKEKQRVLSAPAGRKMSDLETGGPWLSSLPFAILPGETIEIWALFDAGAALGPMTARGMPRMVTEAAYDDLSNARQITLGGQLAASTLLIGFFLAFSRLLRSTPARRYSLYFIAATLNPIAYDGYLTYLFSGFPVLWVMAVNGVIQFAMIILYFRFVLAFVRESIGQHRILRAIKWMIWAVPIAFLFGLGINVIGSVLASNSIDPTFGADLQSFAPRLYGIFIIALWTTLSLWSSALLIRRKTDGAWLFAAGALVLMIAPFGSMLADVFPTPAGLNPTIIRVALVLMDALIFAAALVRLAFGLRAQRDFAVQSELAASREKLRLSESLLASRQNLDAARNLAEQHRSRLALTGHDLRQPLLSLRLALDKEDAVSPTLRDSLSTSLSYLKSVLDQILSDTRPDDVPTSEAQTTAIQAEPIPLQIILQNSLRMFHDEAAQKGLELKMVATSAIVTTEPVALIRILSNLVSNAVKYTPTGRVLLGVRRHGQTFSIEVHDTGPGLTKAQIHDIQQSYHRETTSKGIEGEGIGLASVQMLAAENNLSLSIESHPGKGSCFAINGLI